MAQLTRGQTFGATETVTNTKLHTLVDSATISGIVDADISPSAAIQFSKLLASSISGALLTNLSLIPSASGLIPFANLPVPFGATYVSLVSIPNASLLPLTLASWVDGVALRNLASTPVDQQIRYNLLVASLASGAVPVYNGANNFVGAMISPVGDAAGLALTDQNIASNGAYVDISGLSLSLTLAKQSNVFINAAVSGFAAGAANEVRWSLFRDSTILMTGASYANSTTRKSQPLGAKDSALAAGTYTYKVSLKSADGGSRTYSNEGYITAIAIPT